MASTSSPAFTCPDRTICEFQYPDYTGNVYEVDATDPLSRNRWLPYVYHGSFNNNTDSDVGLWTGYLICLHPRTRDVGHGATGLYLHYGVSNNCSGIPAP